MKTRRCERVPRGAFPRLGSTARTASDLTDDLIHCAVIEETEAAAGQEKGRGYVSILHYNGSDSLPLKTRRGDGEDYEAASMDERRCPHS
jgi:hypothetical protein